MPIVVWQDRRTMSNPYGSANVYLMWKRFYWERSPRVNGHLVLQANPASRRKMWDHRVYLKDPRAMPYVKEDGYYYYDFPIYDQTAYRLEGDLYKSLRRKLYNGGASLGVTAASYRQSRDMIINRYNTLNVSADKFLAKTTTSMSKKKLADLVLETLFGWVPLVADVQAAAMSVIQHSPTSHRAKVRKTQVVHQSFNNRHPAAPFEYREWETRGSVMVSYSVHVEIENLNVWLAERAGLLNYAAVAWDVVPWSFAINMFTTTGQVVNSITDYAGLRFSSPSKVFTYRMSNASTYGWSDNPSGLTGPRVVRLTQRSQTEEKFQYVSGLPPPRLELKMPNVNWELTAIAASLFTQKLGSIKRVLQLAQLR